MKNIIPTLNPRFVAGVAAMAMAICSIAPITSPLAGEPAQDEPSVTNGDEVTSADDKEEPSDPTPEATLAELRDDLARQKNNDEWPEAIDTLEKIQAIEDDATRKGLFRYTIAVIYRDKIGDADRAVASYEQALDFDPTRFAAFEAIDRILTKQKKWDALAKAYQRMISRLEDDTVESPEDFRFLLRFHLAHLYHKRLDNPAAACESLQAALALRPNASDAHRLREAISAHHQCETEE